MNAKLRVGNLGLTIDGEKLREIFSHFGTVVGVEISKYELTGRPKGFGFVEMSSRKEALACIPHLNGREEEGRDLIVSDAAIDEQGRQKRRGRR